MLSGQNQLHKSIITICWPVNGSTYHTGACTPIQLWTAIHDKWTKLDLSNATSSTCGFRNGGQNRFSICPPFTYIYLRKRKSGQKWTLFSYILFFFLFFLLYPLLPAIMLLPLFYKTPRFISDYAFFSLFWPLFDPFFAPFHYNSLQFTTPQIHTISRHNGSKPIPNHSPARTRGHTRPPLTSFIYFSF